MTMYETADVGFRQWEEFPEEPTTHPMAIGSVVCSLLICCPVFTIFGPLLGLIALISIGSNPMRRGKGLALAGMVIGTAATVVWLWGGNFFWRTFAVPLMSGPVEVFHSAETGSWQAVRSELSGPAARATDEELAAFFEEVTRRYGAFQSIRLADNQTGQPAQGTDGSARISLEYRVSFAQGTVDLTVDWLMAEPGVVVMKPEGLFLTHTDGTFLSLPAAPAGLESPPDESPPDESPAAHDQHDQHDQNEESNP